MTKDEYIKWKNERNLDSAKWDYATCAAADCLIKTITCLNFKAYLQNNFRDLPLSLQD